jgi:hypothetical protein
MAGIRVDRANAPTIVEAARFSLWGSKMGSVTTENALCLRHLPVMRAVTGRADISRPSPPDGAVSCGGSGSGSGGGSSSSSSGGGGGSSSSSTCPQHNARGEIAGKRRVSSWGTYFRNFKRGLGFIL